MVTRWEKPQKIDPLYLPIGGSVVLSHYWWSTPKFHGAPTNLQMTLAKPSMFTSPSSEPWNLICVYAPIHYLYIIYIYNAYCMSVCAYVFPTRLTAAIRCGRWDSRLCIEPKLAFLEPKWLRMCMWIYIYIHMYVYIYIYTTVQCVSIGMHMCDSII